MARVNSRTATGVAAAVATELLYGCSFVFTKGAVELVTPAALLAWIAAGLAAALGDEPCDVCECGSPVDRYTPTGQPMCAACYAQAMANEAA